MPRSASTKRAAGHSSSSSVQGIARKAAWSARASSLKRESAIERKKPRGLEDLRSFVAFGSERSPPSVPEVASSGEDHDCHRRLNRGDNVLVAPRAALL